MISVKLSDHPIVVILGLTFTLIAAIAACVAIYSFITGNQSLQPTESPAMQVKPLDTPTMSATGGSCPYRELADEINIGDNPGACATLPLAQFLQIMNNGSLLSTIDELDHAFEADIRTGYQYRQLIPARIPSAPPRQRVLWGSLTWIEELASGEKERINSRIFRIWCNYTNPCIYVILDGKEFNVGFAGRGILLSEPLSDELLTQLRK